MREAARIRQVRNKAYAGPRGAERQRFCLAYRETLARILAKAADALVSELALKGEKVSCSRGCAYCCFQHISAPAAHAITVVDYLYSNDEALAQFLRNYGPWREAVGGLSDEIDAVYNSALDPSQRWSPAQETGKALACRYLSLQIPCPFLVKSACIIHQVRPVCCASHYSVSPPERCSATDLHDIRTYEAMPSSSELQELVKLAPLRLSLYHAAIPTMVYKLLTEDLPDILSDIDNQFPAGTTERVLFGS